MSKRTSQDTNCVNTDDDLLGSKIRESEPLLVISGIGGQYS